MHCASPLRPTAITVVVALSLLGCGEDETPQQGEPPERSQPPKTTTPPGATPTCAERLAGALAKLPASLEASEGGRISLDLPTELAAEQLTLEGLPAGGRSWRADDQLWIRLPYASGEHELSLAVSSCDAGVRHELALSVRPLRWSRAATWVAGQDGPAAREHSPMLIDQRDPDRLLLLGGFLYEPQQFTIGTDAWALELESGSWRLLPGGAPPLAGGRLAAVPGEQIAYLHGGQTSQGFASSNLVRVDYGSDALPLEEIKMPDGPTAVLAALVVDHARDRVLSVCGIDGQSLHCDVHAAKLSDPSAGWRKLPLSGKGPTGRFGFAHGYDAEGDRLIVFSGDQGLGAAAGTPAEDTWALELESDPPRWRRLVGPDPDVPGRRNSCWALDPQGRRLLVWGGTRKGLTSVKGLHVLHLDEGHEAWQVVDVPGAPPVRSSCVGLYDSARHRALLGFGNSEIERFADLWALEL